MQKEIILITGASRGIGRALALEMGTRGFMVLVTARTKDKATETADTIVKAGGTAEGFKLDVTEPKDLHELAKDLTERFGQLDVLVNNAGIYDSQNNSVLSTTEETLIETLKTNTFGPLRIIQELVPLLMKSQNARIVNVSSGMGALTEMGPAAPAYRLSKTALNVLTILLSHELKDKKIRINSICPGWVQTDMGGSNAPRNLYEGIGSVIAMIDTPTNGPTGGFYRDGEPLAW